MFISFVIGIGSRKIGVMFNNIGVHIYRFVSDVLSFIIWIWTKLGILLTMKSKRDQEYKADAFSKKLGYSNGLISFFYRILEQEKYYKKEKNIFSILTSSHPKTKKRIEKIMNK